MAKEVSIEVKCPHCRNSLMDKRTLIDNKPSIKLNIQTETEYGTIRLCSVFGCHKHLCDFEINNGEIVRFFCPDCNQEIKGKIPCELCDAPMIPFPIKAGGRVWVCSREGCKNHFVAFQDLDTEIKKFYDEYGF